MTCALLHAATSFGRHVAPGKKALLPQDKPRVQVDAACSVNIDKHGPPSPAGVKRWDYVLVQRETGAAHAVEVHPANTGAVGDAIAKKAWAVAMLRAETPGLVVLRWHWVASGRVDIRAHERAVRRLNDAGIAFPRGRVSIR